MNQILIILFWFGAVKALDVVSNFTYDKEMAAKCKQHICRNGYIYDNYYRIENNVWKPSDPNVSFEMHIAIQAASNGHILLSPVEHAGFSDPVYEIVVGGGGNTFTELRRNLRRNAKASAKTLGILSNAELRGFYIKITKDGQLEFGREGELLPIISIYDVDPLDINYFSFASWTGVDARFLYDCPAPGIEAQNSTEVDKSSISDKLKRKILLSRFPSLPPAQNMSVEVGTILISARYDSFDAKLITDLAFVTSWKDKNAAWDPDQYNGTTRLNFRQTQIWRPTFLVYNANTLDPLDANNAGLITMDYSGENIFHFRTKVESWCVVDDTTSLNKWPMDSYDCIVVIRPFQVHELINLKLLKPTDVKMKFYTDIDIKVRNEWETTATSLVFSSKQWLKLHNTTVNDVTESDVLVIYVTMQRKAVALNMAIYTPLVVLVTFVLMSFWTESLTMTRVWFYAGCAATISFGLCYIEYIMPCHNVPSLLILYVTVLGGILIALLLQVILMTSLVKAMCETQPMQNLLTSSVFRKVFLLAPMTTVTKNYDTLNEGFSYDGEDEAQVSPRSANIEEMVADACAEKTNFGDSVELAEAFDKLFFFVYSMVFAVLLALHF
ncbi:acetylcholine receptor subunit alpha-type unc-38-like isoform X2 [Plodia interpunctella]|uniref:acetylcholine receptor subunit alpha-type unc-38-like isoform X2 n=1 Tax=Plodia interpunctella TaxID=58824 RepID=UPI00236795B3|nr:acetylcholine receptor subunit alpha-type unc-38-like isoform X2 [Plodia interpunctella]